MKIFTIALVFILLSNYNLFAQQKDYIELYHKVIYQGDLKMLEKQYDSALTYYEQAFSNVPYAFGFDYVTGAWLAYKTSKIEKACAYLDSAVLRGLYIGGVHKEYFNNKEKWNEYKENKYPELFKIGQSRRNIFLVNLIDSLIKEDQKVRINVSDEEFFRLSPKVDSSNAEILKAYINKSLMGEDVLGLECSWDFNTVLVHKLLMDSDLMYKLYKEGKIYKVDYYYCIVRKSLQFDMDSKYLYADKKKNINNKELDKKRTEDGIPSIEMAKKLRKLRSSFYYPIM